MEQGWIKLHRKLRSKGYYKHSAYVHLWVHLLLLANHESKEFMWNDSIIIVKEGQLITGRKQLSKETGISQTTIERILNMLENEHQIGQQKTTKYRLITILNWKEHQQVDSKVDNKRTTNGQQTDTNKNDKNVKNEKKNTGEAISPEIKMVIQSFEGINPEYTRWYGNKTQRSACKWLLGEFGLEGTLKKIEYLPRLNSRPYSPVTTTPDQLVKNLAKIKSYLEKEQTNFKSKVIKIIQ